MNHNEGEKKAMKLLQMPFNKISKAYSFQAVFDYRISA